MDEPSTVVEPNSEESDSRFPSGPWTGFFLQPTVPGRTWMELHLRFANLLIQGEGRDKVGRFAIDGRYDLGSGRCHWIKTYLGKHKLSYQGFNESKGIWGVWEYHPTWKGGFHIWPVGMADPTQQRLAESIDEPTFPSPFEAWSDQPAEEVEVAGGVRSATKAAFRRQAASSRTE